MLALGNLEQARLWLRIAEEDFDGELSQTAEACLLDLKNAGVKQTDPQNPLIQQAIKLYLKAQFGYDNEREKFEKAYEHLKAALALSGEYNREGT